MCTRLSSYNANHTCAVDSLGHNGYTRSRHRGTQWIQSKQTPRDATDSLEADTAGRNRYTRSRHRGTQWIRFLNRGVQILRSRSLSLLPQLRLSLLLAQRGCAPRHLEQKLPTFKSTKFFIGMRFGNSDFTARGITPFPCSWDGNGENISSVLIY